MRQGDQGVDDNLAFLSAFQDEVADFHMACADSGATDAAERVLSHVGTLRAMVSDAEGDDAAMLKEMHAACVAKAAAWVERRIQDLVAQFHLRWHDDGDLLAVDCALRESMTLVRHAEAELGPLPVCVEVLGGCDQQLCTKLAEHVRRANRHELRMLFADFCQWVGREELQQLCLDKYREQVDKHVQSEAVATQIKLLNLLQAKSLRTSVGGTNGVGASAGAGAVAGAGGGVREAMLVFAGTQKVHKVLHLGHALGRQLPDLVDQRLFGSGHGLGLLRGLALGGWVVGVA
jgi:hypothetical protein